MHLCQQRRLCAQSALDTRWSLNLILRSKNTEKNGGLVPHSYCKSMQWPHFYVGEQVKSPRQLLCACRVAFLRNVSRLVAQTEYSMCKATPHRRCYKKRRDVFSTGLQIENTLLIPLCPLRASLLTALPAEVLTGRIKTLSSGEQFLPTHMNPNQF